MISFAQISQLISLANSPMVQKWLGIGLPVIEEMQKTHPDLVPVIEQAGATAFPALAGSIHLGAAVVSGLFNKQDKGVAWVQAGLNKLAAAGVFQTGLRAPIKADGVLGNESHAVVKAYQAIRPLLVADGWPGVKTQAAMAADLAKLPA